MVVVPGNEQWCLCTVHVKTESYKLLIDALTISTVFFLRQLFRFQFHFACFCYFTLARSHKAQSGPRPTDVPKSGFCRVNNRNRTPSVRSGRAGKQSHSTPKPRKTFLLSDWDYIIEMRQLALLKRGAHPRILTKGKASATAGNMTRFSKSRHSLKLKLAHIHGILT